MKTKREQLEILKRENMRERQEARDDEWFKRDGEDFTIQMIRDKMTRTLTDANITPEERKERLSIMKEEIEVILDAREDREHEFIKHELQRHQAEHELEQQILQDENTGVEPKDDSLNLMFRARSSLNAGAERMRKEIEEKRRELNEEEQFSTILISNSERDAIPNFAKPRSRRKREKEPEQAARIDTVLIKQREIGMMYRDSQEQQEAQLEKLGKKVKKVLESPADEPINEVKEHDE